MKKTTFLLSLALLINVGLNAQSNNDKFWSPISESAIKVAGKRQIIPNKYLAFQLIGSELKTQLSSAPSEISVKINQSTCIISLPLPNGTSASSPVSELIVKSVAVCVVLKLVAPPPLPPLPVTLLIFIIISFINDTYDI